MSLFALLIREIRCRHVSFLVSVLVIGVATAMLTAPTLQLAAFDKTTEAMSAAKELELQRNLQQMALSLKNLTVRMGYNTVIVHKDEPIDQLLLTGIPTTKMPADWAARIAQSKPETVNHLLPVLKARTAWPERQRDAVLNGVAGEIYVRSKLQTPILAGIAENEMVIGEALSQALGIRERDSVQFCGEQFVVRGILAGRGAGDDAAVFLNIRTAEKILGRKGEFSQILALSCECSGSDAGIIEREIKKTLPDAKVVLFSQMARSRDDIVRVSNAAAKELAANELRGRDRLRAEKAKMSRLLTLNAGGMALVVVAGIIFSNVRERREEIGILRAIGYSRSKVGALFMGRALIAGLIGSVLGETVGVVAASLDGAVLMPSPSLAFLVLVLGTLLAGLAGSLPAIHAARLDPANLLRSE